MNVDQEVLQLLIRRGLVPRKIIDELLEETGGDAGRAVDLLKRRAIILPEELEGLRSLCGTARISRPVESPRTFGRYEILAELGRGGMSVVYKARDPVLDRLVALKVLQIPEPLLETGQRFEREARTMAKLSHPNIIQVLEVGEIEGKKYFTMQHVEGITFGEWLKRTPGPSRFTRGIEILRDAALALDYAHTQGVIHRDLKPQNIMIERTGRADSFHVYVMDFGLAREIAAPKRLTMTGAIMGTPQYIAPEQARGSRVDRRADVYGLGAVLYEILTGFPPFFGPTVYAIINKALSEEPIPPRERNDRIPSDLETICLRAMEKIPEKRYQSAREFADELERYLRGEPIAARPEGPVRRLVRRLRRQRVLIGSVLGVLVAGSVAAVIIWNLLEKSATQLKQAQQQQQEAEALRRQAMQQKERRDRAMLQALRAQRLVDQFEFAILNRPLETSDIESYKLPILECVDRALEIDPQFGMPHALRGRLFELLGDTVKAQADYEAAIRAEPSSVYGHYYLGRLYVTRFENSRILPEVRVRAEGVELAETPALPQAGVYLQAALRHFDNVRELYLKFAQAEIEYRMSQALSHIYEGRYTEARAQLEKIVDRVPDAPDVYHYLGVCRFYLKDFDGAVQDLTRAQRRAGRHPRIYLHRAMAYHCLGLVRRDAAMLEAAVSDATMGLRLQRQADLLQVRAMALLELALLKEDPRVELQRATKDLEEATALQREFAPLYALLGLAYARLGPRSDDPAKTFELAETSCTRAIELQETADTLYLRGTVRFELKQYPQALEDWERCRELSPGFGGQALDEQIRRVRDRIKSDY